jgi:hypothetical protein
MHGQSIIESLGIISGGGLLGNLQQLTMMSGDDMNCHHIEKFQTREGSDTNSREVEEGRGINEI